MKALNRKLLRDLAAMKVQLGAIALVMACGVAAFVMARTALVSLQESRDQYYATQRFADVFATFRRAPDDVVRDLAEIPGVAAADTRVVLAATLEVPSGEGSCSARVLSLPRQAGAGLNLLHLRRGRWPESVNEVLVGDAFAAAHRLEPGAVLPAVIHGHRFLLRVTGTALSPEFIYAIRPGEFLPDDRRFGILWMPRDAVAAAGGLRGACNDAALRLHSGASPAAVLDAVDRVLEPWGGTGAVARRDQLSARMVDNEIRELNAMATLVPGIFLFVAAFLLRTVLARLIGTQREQMAAIRAFGYPGSRIAWHYLKLALVVGAAGALMGLAGGLWLGRNLMEMYAQFFRFPLLRYEAVPGLLVSAGMLCPLAAALAVWSAVGAAARTPPAEAMRPEAPARFRTVAGEAFLRAAGPRGMMVLRHLMHHPWRTAGTVLGIALGAAVLILGSFSGDLFREVIGVLYRGSQRHDYQIALHEPAGPDAARALRHLPGVLSCESFRTVPVRIRCGPHDRLVPLTAYGEERNLVPVVDRRLQPVPIERGGVAISRELARILGVRSGGTVDLDVLEGRRRTVTATVTSLIDDLAGLQAVIRLADLPRYTDSGATVSGAFVRIDSGAQDVFQEAAAAAPAIAGVTSRAAMIGTFQRTMAETLLRMRFFNALFAAIIACGVIYNTGRIAVAEHRREFASLRVLGFTPSEVASLLFLETGLVLSIGLPLGLLMGRALAGAVVSALATETLRLPAVVHPPTYAFAATVIAAASLAAALAVRRQLRQLDLIAVLKAGD
jgi:putative ABC transport system permease protein